MITFLLFLSINCSSSSNIFAIGPWFTFTCFFKNVIPFYFIIWNYPSFELCSWICGINWIVRSKYIMHYLWILNINICIIIYIIKKPNITKFFHDVSIISFAHVIFWCYSTLILVHFHLLDFYLFSLHN